MSSNNTPKAPTPKPLRVVEATSNLMDAGRALLESVGLAAREALTPSPTPEPHAPTKPLRNLPVSVAIEADQDTFELSAPPPRTTKPKAHER